MEEDPELIVIVPRQEHTPSLRRKSAEQLSEAAALHSQQLKHTLQKVSSLLLEEGIQEDQLEPFEELGFIKIHGIAVSQQNKILRRLADNGLQASTIESESELID